MYILNAVYSNENIDIQVWSNETDKILYKNKAMNKQLLVKSI